MFKHSRGMEIYHPSLAFLTKNRPSDFKDMRVLVVGIGNSAADTSTALIGSAKNIYLSHRGGVQIVTPSSLPIQSID